MSPRLGFGAVALGLAGLHVVLALLVFEPTLFAGGDNARYLILGEALGSGAGYRDLHLPGAPAHTLYPPLLPLLLAVPSWVGGVGLAKAAMIVLSGMIVWATARLGRAWVGAEPAVGAAAVLAVSPTLLEYSHYILSEVPFTLLVVTAVWVAVRDDARGAAWALVAAAAAFATRTAGMAVLAALPLAWLLIGRRRWAAWSAVAMVAVMGAWALYQRIAGPEASGYLAQLVLEDPYAPDSGTVALGGLVARAAQNAWTYVSVVIPHMLLGRAAGTSAGAAGTVLGLGVAAAALAGWASRARGRLGVAEVAAVLYVGLIAVWPPVWSDQRFLLPIWPLVLLLAFASLRRLPARRWRWLKWAAPGTLAALGLAWVAATAPGRLSCVASYSAGAPCDAAALASFYDAARWAGEHTAAGSIVANRKPEFFYWYGRRQGDVYPFSSDPAAVMRGLEEMDADYVVVDAISATTTRYLIPAIQAHPARFEIVYSEGSPNTSILRLLPDAARVD